MYIARHHVCQYLINHPMSLQAAAAAECLRLDPHLKVPGAIASARMAGMPGAVVDHRHAGRCKRRLELGPDAFNAGQCHPAWPFRRSRNPQVWASRALSHTARLSVVLEQNINPFTRSDTKAFFLFDLKANL
jgi:hypothetical protein